MKSQKSKILFVIMAVLAGGAGWAWGDIAVTVNPEAVGLTGIDHEISLGYRFYVDKPIVVTHLGIFDSIYTSGGVTYNGPGLKGTHTVALWRLLKTGELVLERSVTIGPGAELSDSHAWVALGDESFTINPDPVPEFINGVACYEKWMVGVWTPNYLYDVPVGQVGDAQRFSSQAAVTFNCVQDGIVRFDGYTKTEPAYYFVPPELAVSAGHHGVNFKYEQPTPVVVAGPDVTIYSSEQGLTGEGEPLTAILGTATDPYPGPGALMYQWLKEGEVLQDWLAVGAGGMANLNLTAPVPVFAVGEHTLTLEVKDGMFTVSDSMVLTVCNTPPEAQPSPTYQVVEINVDAILVTAEVADFDGDQLSYQWLKGGDVHDSGTIDSPAGGAAVFVPDLAIPAGDPRFPLGVTEVQFVVSDGVNPAVISTVSVEVKDTTAPTVAPTASVNLLWPPNHTLRPITIWANAADNGGGPITLTVNVQSSEDSGDEMDWYVDSIDSATGVIQLRLRAERSGNGDGRVYTIVVTATDQSANESSATVAVRVPHDQKKKK